MADETATNTAPASDGAFAGGSESERLWNAANALAEARQEGAVPAPPVRAEPAAEELPITVPSPSDKPTSARKAAKELSDWRAQEAAKEAAMVQSWTTSNERLQTELNDPQQLNERLQSLVKDQRIAMERLNEVNAQIRGDVERAGELTPDELAKLEAEHQAALKKRDALQAEYDARFPEARQQQERARAAVEHLANLTRAEQQEYGRVA